jgi:hypothetical protein
MRRARRGRDSAIQQPGAKDGCVVALVKSLDAQVEAVDLGVDVIELAGLLIEQRAGRRGGGADGTRRAEQGDDRRGRQTSAAAGSHVTQTAARPAPR